MKIELLATVAVALVASSAGFATPDGATATAPDPEKRHHHGEQHDSHEHGGHDVDGQHQSADHDHDATATHSFADVEHWVAVFDDPERDEWQRPDDVIAFLEVGDGHAVADLGAGTGYFTVRLAHAVGSAGRVFAVDIEPGLVEHLRKRAADDGLDQIVTVLAEPDDPKLPAGSMDLVLVVDTWHHLDDRIGYLAGLAAALKPGGKVAVIDFHEGELPVGPPAGHKLSRDAVVAEFEEAGWTLVSENPELPYQYLVVFRPPSS